MDDDEIDPKEVDITKEEVEEADELDEFEEDKNFAWMGRIIRKRQKLKHDLWIAVDGFEGEGKSTFAMKLARAVDKDFTVKRNVIVDPNVGKVEELILRSDVKAIIIDEGSRVLYKRKFASEENVYLNQLSHVCRKANKCVIICIPSFLDMDKGIRRRIRFWFNVPKRGIAGLFVPERNPFLDDPWNIKENMKMYRKSFGYRVADAAPNHIAEILKRSPNYAHGFRFSALEPEVEKEYLDVVAKFRTEMRFQDEQKKKEDKAFYKMVDFKNRFSLLVDRILEKEYMSMKEIAEIMSMDYHGFLLTYKNAKMRLKNKGGALLPDEAIREKEEKEEGMPDEDKGDLPEA